MGIWFPVRRLRAIAALAVGAIGPIVCAAQWRPEPAAWGPYALSVQTGRGIDHNLLQIPRSLASGRLRWEKSWFESVSLSRSLGTLGQRHEALAGTPLEAWQTGYEIVLVQHRGLQRNAEVGLAYQLRTPTVWLGLVGANLSVGAGLSQALGHPTYEDGPDGDPARRYRLQLLALFESEWQVQGMREWSLTVRVHHRSGVYGLIAPRRVGSNFIAAGLRRRF